MNPSIRYLLRALLICAVLPLFLSGYATKTGGQLDHYWVTRTNQTILNVGAACSVGYPCTATLQDVVGTFSQNAAQTATIVAGASDSTVYVYLSNALVLTVGHNSGASKVTCSAGCTATNGIVGFPATSFPLWTWRIQGGSWAATGTDYYRTVQPVAIFPDAVATDVDLPIAKNRIQSTLSSPVTAYAVSLPVSTTTGIIPNMTMTVGTTQADSEVVHVCAVDSVLLTLSVGRSACPHPDGRGLDTAAGAATPRWHQKGSTLNAYFAARHTNAAFSEIKAIERAILEGGIVGGATIGDFWVVRTSDTALSIGPACSATYPCKAELAGYGIFTLSSAQTATLGAAPGDSTVFIYISDALVLTVGHNSGAGKITCSAGCTAVNGITSFPATALPLWTWSVSGGIFTIGGGIDYRTLIGLGAPLDTRYWVSSAEPALANAVNLGSLGSGLLAQTVAGGVSTPSIYAGADCGVGNGIRALSAAGAATACVAVGAGAAHEVLSATHTDSSAAAVQRGDLATGQGVVPAWARLAKGAASTALQSNGTDLLWALLTGANFGPQVANRVFAGPALGADANPTFRALVAADIPDISATYAPTTRTITAGAGLTGGGNLSADRTIDVATANTSLTVNADSLQVNPRSAGGLDVSSGLGLLTTCADDQSLLYTAALGWHCATAAGPAGPAGPVGPAGPAGPDGEPGVPGYSPNTLLSGGGVVWTGGLNFTVSAATYLINNVQYTSAQADLTLSAADPADPRIDAIVVNSSGVAAIVEGAAAPTAARPDIDPASQLQLTFVYIAAGAAVPSDVVTTADIYHENAEWTTAKSGAPINLASAVNPHLGVLDIEGTAATTGNYARFTAPAPIDLAESTYLAFYLRSKAAWPSTRSLQLRWYSGTAGRGSTVVLNEGAFGFVSSQVATYQQIVVPVSLFMANGLSVNRLQITVSGTGATIGFYLDDIILQGGLPTPTSPTGMTWKGAWNATTSYAVNDVVISGGLPYVALLQNANSTPPVAGNATWAVLDVLTLASAQFANQGTTTTVLHGNAAGNPSWASVTGSDFANQTQNTVLAGPETAPAAAPTFRALVPADYPTLVGDSGAGGTKGAVPAPAAGDGAAGKVLKADGNWGVVAGGTTATGDFWAVRTAPTTLVMGQNCTVATPCRVRFTGPSVDITASGTGTVVAGASDGLAYIYVDGSTSRMTVGHDSGASKVTCDAGCDVAEGITAFPAGSIPLWTWSIASENWTPAGNDYRTTTSGPSASSDHTDLRANKTTATRLTISGAANVRFGNTGYAFTGPATVDLAGAETGAAYVYYLATGLTVGHNITDGNVTCTGCTKVAGVTAFPSDSIPLWVWNITAGNWDATGTDWRAYLSAKKISPGAGIQTSESGGTTTVAVDSATAAAATATALAANPAACPGGEFVSDIAADGTLTCGAPAGANHAMLSATHTDSTAAAVVRGDVIAGIGVAPKWERLAKGAQYTVLQAGANEPAYDAVHLDQAAAVTGNLPVANGGTGANNTATAGRYLKGDGSAFATSTGSASGTGSCTNQFVTATNSDAAPTCSTATLAGAQFANQGTTTTLLHGNAAGNPSWGAVVSADLPSAITTGLVSAEIDGQGSVITTGGVGCKRLAYAVTITGYRIYESTIPAITGSIAVDIWVDTTYQPTVADTITAAAKPALVAGTTACGNVGGSGGCNDITTWTRPVASGAYVCFNVDSAADAKKVVLDLEITK